MTARYLSLTVVFLACIFVHVQARAEPVTYEQAVTALEAASKLRQTQLNMWRGEPDALRARLAKNPPGPGWADFGWSDSPVAGDTDSLLLLIRAAKDLGLLGKKDMASRLILFNIAHRYEIAAARLVTERNTLTPYLMGLEGMPEYSRFMELAHKRWKMDKEAWLLAAAYLKQECGADKLPPDAWKHSTTETAPEFRRFKQKIEKIRVEADGMAKRYGARITSNWPGKLENLLEDVRARADLGSMALAANISESTSKDALITLGYLFRMHEDGHERAKDLFTEEPVGGPPWSEPEKKLARKALSELDPLHAIDYGKLVPVVNRAEELLDAK